MADDSSSNPSTIGAMAAGMAAAAGMFQSAAIVGALAEAGAVDPKRVAAWAEMFADGQSQNLSAEVRSAVAEHLRGFAKLVTSLPTKQPGSTAA